MNSIWSGFCVAFSLYSAVPVPQVPWEKKTMRWALSFLPLVGVLIGLLELLWFRFCTHFGADTAFYAIFAALLPLAVSGGIHLDGLADTCDALCSYGDREKRLGILKDPHIGAFGVIWLASFLLAEAACFAQVYRKPAFFPVAAAGFALSRILGGRKIVTQPCAKDSGLAYLFAEGSDKKTVAATLLMEGLFYAAGLLCWGMYRGFRVLPLLYLAALAIWSLWHKRVCGRDFGGVTGDLVGFFISVSELAALAFAAVGGLII